MEYGEYKSKIRVIRKDGSFRCEFLTWRGDIIANILEATTLGHTFSPDKDDKMVIEVIANSKEFEILKNEDL